MSWQDREGAPGWLESCAPGGCPACSSQPGRLANGPPGRPGPCSSEKRLDPGELTPSSGAPPALCTDPSQVGHREASSPLPAQGETLPSGSRPSTSFFRLDNLWTLWAWRATIETFGWPDPDLLGAQGDTAAGELDRLLPLRRGCRLCPDAIFWPSSSLRVSVRCVDAKPHQPLSKSPLTSPFPPPGRLSSSGP